MNAIPPSERGRTHNATPSKFSDALESTTATEFNTTCSAPQVATHYRAKHKDSAGRVQWITVQGKALKPVASPEKMALIAKDHARDEWRRQWQLPAGHVERTPSEHRAALAALDAIDAAPKRQKDAMFALTLDLLGGR